MEMSCGSVGSAKDNVSARRRVLYSSVCAICHENEFSMADKPSLDTLLQMLQSVIFEIGRSSQAFCELSGRTEPLVGDVVMALVEMGLNIDDLSSYAMRSTRVTIPSPQVMAKQSTPRILQAGEKKTPSAYIPDYLPAFPDPHSYIRTPTHKQPVTEYEAIREKSATQKRDVERALTKFMAKTCGQSLTHRLFPDEQISHLFPLILLKVESNPYLNALLPKDQVFDDNEEQLIRKKESDKKPKLVVNATDETNSAISGETATAEQTNELNKSSLNTSTTDNDVLDNPYLRPIKMSSRKRSRKQFET